ncbi:hypothetical protein M404DRAFT_17580 [Pisolithus tinctorius Marx 270]|uniref:CCHC-type domain-containing protein n=1 Tax=Pisolithus tinctorius Marx 270 TaxID=870435 RepID=A0A0C3PKG2_PISTI|nr:hypothetical protein M404DRAFT_17580 [Pisolithus tinctorius Marx 270]
MVKDDHSLQVSTLNVDGSNWLYYKAWVEWAISLKGLIGHLTSLDVKPEDPSAGKDSSWKPTATEQKLVSEYPEELWQWAKDDGYVKQEETVKSVWGVLTDLFQNFSHIVIINLQRKLQESCCVEKGDVCAHFDKMCTLHEQLATLGQSITDNNFTAIILSSLLASYNSNLAAMMSLALVMQKDLSPDFIIKVISDKYDRCQMWMKRGNSGNSRNSKDTAYSAKDGKKSTCENCGNKGHVKDQCWEEGGGKAGQAPKWFQNKGKGKKREKGSGKAATAASATASLSMQTSADSEPNGVWLVHLQDDDWLMEIAEEEIPNPWDIIIDEEDAYTNTLDHALLAGESLNSTEETILFDSGASCHMSYHSKFLDYKPIIHKPITTADNHTFHAIRKGNLGTPLPNGTAQTHIQLKDMLYAPKMGIMLISISKLDVAGYAALF